MKGRLGQLTQPSGFMFDKPYLPFCTAKQTIQHCKHGIEHVQLPFTEQIDQVSWLKYFNMFIEYVKEGKLSHVQAMIERGMDPHCEDPWGSDFAASIGTTTTDNMETSGSGVKVNGAAMYHACISVYMMICIPSSIFNTCSFFL